MELIPELVRPRIVFPLGGSLNAFARPVVEGAPAAQSQVRAVEREVHNRRAVSQMLTLAELQPYLAAAGTALGVATLGFVIKLAETVRNAERARAEVIEERLKKSEENLLRTEKWSEREKQELTAKNEQLRAQLEAALSGSGLTLQALAFGGSLQEVKDAVKESINSLVEKMERAEATNQSVLDPPWHLELAKAFMAQGEWDKAAAHFDKYVQFNPLDSDTQFSRGVAYANIRGGDQSNVAALRAYNEAIALAPKSLDKRLRARFFGYRGAMFKRLGRLAEAESDLNLALGIAERDYERNDIKYNLACVYALKGERAKMLGLVRELKGHRREIDAIRFHVSDFFAEFANDTEFKALIG